MPNLYPDPESPMPDTPNTDTVRSYLLDLQDRICDALADEDGGHVFASELWQHERNVEVARQAGLL